MKCSPVAVNSSSSRGVGVFGLPNGVVGLPVGVVGLPVGVVGLPVGVVGLDPPFGGCEKGHPITLHRRPYEQGVA